ncbi:MAG: hypothetical protein ACPG06_02940, partial [Alphaproteobacteria bacterium]
VTVGDLTVRDVHAVIMPGGPIVVGNEVWDESVLTFDYETGEAAKNNGYVLLNEAQAKAARPGRSLDRYRLSGLGRSLGDGWWSPFGAGTCLHHD